MRKQHQFTKSIILRFVTILLMIMIMPFIFLLITTSNTTREIERERAAEFLSGNLRVISSTTDSFLRSIESERTAFLINSSFVKAVKQIEPYDIKDEYTDFKAVQKIKRTMFDASIRNPLITSIYLYSGKAERLFISGVNWVPSYNKIDLTDTPWFSSYLNNPEKIPWHITEALDSKDAILTCYCTFEEYNKPLIALLSFNASPDAILDTIREANSVDGGLCFIADAYGQIIAGSDADPEFFSRVANELPEGSASGTMDVQVGDDTIFASYLRSSYSGFTYIATVPLDKIQLTTHQMTILTIGFIVESILVLILCILLVYHFFFRPIKSLAAGMKRFEAGDFKVRMPENRTDEIGLINKQFNEMTHNIDRLITENYVNELAKRDIQLELAHNQINEHFLYNTLDSIHWLSKKSNNADIDVMIRALANFYRISLSNGNDEITLGEAEKMIEDYLHLHRIRFGNALNYTIDFDSQFAGIQIPKHIFIPLIENAIGHGLSGKDHGNISVSLKMSEAGMRFSVMDDGLGISTKRLQEITEKLNSSDTGTGDCFALRNINSQLMLYFGNKDGIQIASTEGVGTTMWFDIPLTEEKRSTEGEKSDV